MIMNTTIMNSALSQAADKPKTSKHLMERKRRARINDSLLQLKSLVFPTLRKEVERHPKLEKADILEMTVRHIQELQQQSTVTSPANVSQFHAGFSECLSEVSRFLSNCDNLELDTRLRIMNHLADKCSTMPEPVPTAERHVLHHSPLMIQHQQPQTTVHRHPQRSPAPRHSPYGYHHRVQSTSLDPVIPSEQRVPQMHYAPTTTQNNLLVVIPADSYPSTVVPTTSPRVQHKDFYPTPPQSPVEETPLTKVSHAQYHHSAALVQTVSSASSQQTYLPSPVMHVPVPRPIQVEEPVWRPW